MEAELSPSGVAAALRTVVTSVGRRCDPCVTLLPCSLSFWKSTRSTSMPSSCVGDADVRPWNVYVSCLRSIPGRCRAVA